MFPSVKEKKRQRIILVVLAVASHILTHDYSELSRLEKKITSTNNTYDSVTLI